MKVYIVTFAEVNPVDENVSDEIGIFGDEVYTTEELCYEAAMNWYRKLKDEDRRMCVQAYGYKGYQDKIDNLNQYLEERNLQEGPRENGIMFYPMFENDPPLMLMVRTMDVVGC